MKAKNEIETNRRDNPGPPATPAVRGIWRKMLNVFLGLLIIGAGVAGATYFNKTAPQARKRPPEKMIPLVQIETVYPDTHRVVVPGMGTVIPARELVLNSRVAGEIVEIHPDFRQGGNLQAGDGILRIDPQDYQLAVVQKQGEVADARYALKLEQGHQDVAKREWELLNGGKPADPSDIELALRKPHLAKAKADLKAAEADLKQARLHLDRTRIRVPFNAIVRTKNIELGSQVATQDQLAELVCTDEYWIQVSMPVDRLKWISIPLNSGQIGAPVRILYRDGFERTGMVINLLGDLETDGRMARVLVAVKDPLGLKTADKQQPPLLIGEYVRVEIEGRELDQVYRIPRTALRDNTSVWIAGNDGRLDIRKVEAIWRDVDAVLVRRGLQPGERLVISDLAAPVQAMPVLIEGDASGKKSDELAAIP